ncbi:MAG: LIC10604 family protein, partial [Blastocatellia bacterium]
DKHGQKITDERVESTAPRLMVTRIADANLPFGGSWKYEIEKAGDGSIITITEDGEVYNPVFRFVSRFIMGHSATIEGYLKDLGNKFGEQVKIEA